MKSQPSNNDLGEHIHKLKHNFETDLQVKVLKKRFQIFLKEILGGLLVKHLQTYNPVKEIGLNEKVGNYAKLIYQNLT